MAQQTTFKILLLGPRKNRSRIAATNKSITCRSHARPRRRIFKSQHRRCDCRWGTTTWYIYIYIYKVKNNIALRCYHLTVRLQMKILNFFTKKNSHVTLEFVIVTRYLFLLFLSQTVVNCKWQVCCYNNNGKVYCNVCLVFVITYKLIKQKNITSRVVSIGTDTETQLEYGF